MAKVYEAMKRAEEERKRKLGAEASVPTPVHWDEAASDVADDPSLWRMVGRNNMECVAASTHPTTIRRTSQQPRANSQLNRHS